MTNNLFARMRQARGLTQEELSARSGVSVRTIRNFERGVIERPRRSSIDMLLTVLDPEHEQLGMEQLNELAVRAGSVQEWLGRIDLSIENWHGPRPPRTSLVGRDGEADRLAELVTGQQVMILTGPGGVGKSRLALAVAQMTRQVFAGVTVTGMGGIPPERQRGGRAAMELAVAAVGGLLADNQRGGRHLLVLDNTEHLACTTTLLVDRLLNDHPGLHIVITARRAPVLPGAGIWELGPLSREAALELLSDRLRISCPGLGCEQNAGAAELVEQLDRLPRLVEFAAHRLRTVPLSALLSSRNAMRLLGPADMSALPHQRSLEASLRWSLDLLDERHCDLLARLARRDCRSFSIGVGADARFDAETVELLADLVESSLLQVDRGRRYEYRMFRHVQALLTDGQGAAATNEVAPDRHTTAA